MLINDEVGGYYTLSPGLTILCPSNLIAMEEDDVRTRSPQRNNSVVSGVNPLMRRGSAVSSSAQKTPPPIPQILAPPSTPPPPPPPPPVYIRPPASPPPTKFASVEDDLVRQSVALSFSGVYPDRNSDVDDGYQLPGIPEDDYLEMDHPLAEKPKADEEDSEEEEQQRPQQHIPPTQPPPPIPSPPSSPSNTGPSPISVPLVRQPSQPLPALTTTQTTSTEAQTAPPLSPKAPASAALSASPVSGSDAAHTSPVEYEKIGIGWKLCPSVNVLWQERFFVMKRDGTIHYYADRTAYVEKYAPKGVINLADLQNNPTSRNGVYDSVELMHDKLNIYVRSKDNRIYKLKFGTAEEAKAWRDAIYRHVKRIYP